MTKRLYRTKPRIIAGVSSGLGEYFNIDPTIFRIIFILLALPGGVPGPLLYILMWIVMPEKPKHSGLQP